MADGQGVGTIKLSDNKRYNMYKEMLKYEPKIWRQEHHIVKVLVNVLMGNLALFMFYKLYYHCYDIKFPFYKSLLKPRFMFWTLMAVGVNYSLIYLNYSYLPKLIYEDFYSKAIISDTDFLDLYDHLVTKEKLIK